MDILFFIFLNWWFNLLFKIHIIREDFCYKSLQIPNMNFVNIVLKHLGNFYRQVGFVYMCEMPKTVNNNGFKFLFGSSSSAWEKFWKYRNRMKFFLWKKETKIVCHLIRFFWIQLWILYFDIHIWIICREILICCFSTAWRLWILFVLCKIIIDYWFLQHCNHKLKNAKPYKYWLRRSGQRSASSFYKGLLIEKAIEHRTECRLLDIDERPRSLSRT